MIRSLISTGVIILLLCGSAAAQAKMEQQESGLSAWLKSMQKKLDIVNPRKTMPMTTGVAGVRGAKGDNGKDKLYWKGKKGEQPVTEAELKEFKEALGYCEAGDARNAVHELEEFMQQYPDSSLIPDVKKTLDLVKAAPPAAKAEAAPAAAAGPAAEAKPAAQPDAKPGPMPEAAPAPQAETK